MNIRRLGTTAGIALLCLCLLAGCGKSNQGSTEGVSSDSSRSGNTTMGQTRGATATSDTAFLPDPNLTPGDTLDVTMADICTPGYAKKVRDVPAEVKRQAYEEYGIAHHEPGEYEVDHLISLELGGSNSIKNLWPQSYQTHPWNAHVKDALENELHRQVCSGQIDLKTAQQTIAGDWIAAYKRIFRTDAPITSRKQGERASRTRESNSEEQPAETSAPSGSATEQVWVNTRSGKYFRPGARYYGRTKEGKYMSEAEAQQEGFQPAGE